MNQLTENTNSGRLAVTETTTSQNSNTLTVNGINAQVYGDATFAAANILNHWSEFRGQAYFSRGLGQVLWGIVVCMVVAIAAPYFHGIITSKDIRAMEAKRAAKIFAAVKSLRSQLGGGSTASYLNNVRDYLLPRDYTLFDIVTVSNLVGISGDTILLRSKDDFFNISRQWSHRKKS